MLEQHDWGEASGFGLRCNRNIRAGEVVVEYMGVVRSATRMEFSCTSQVYTVVHMEGPVGASTSQCRCDSTDASLFGNLSRFAKDELAAPNMELVMHAPVLEATHPRFFLVAIKDLSLIHI